MDHKKESIRSRNTEAIEQYLKSKNDRNDVVSQIVRKQSASKLPKIMRQSKQSSDDSFNRTEGVKVNAQLMKEVVPSPKKTDLL